MSSTSSKGQAIGPKQFPWKLHEMLETAEKNGEDNIVSWMPDGRSFKVHDREKFVDGMMKVFFNQTKYKSFQRQLNLWGFERISNRDPNEKGAYYHPLFVKGRRDLCPCMTRQKSAQVAGTSDLQVAGQPNPAVAREDLLSISDSSQSLRMQAINATRSMSNAELVSMLTAPEANVAPGVPKDILALQHALRNQMPGQLPFAATQSANDQLALAMLRQSLEVQALSPEVQLAALLARKREQEAELAAILAIAASRSRSSALL